MTCFVHLFPEFYKRVTALKSPDRKVLLAIGGWNDSEGDKYSRLVSSPATRKKFIDHVVDFLKQHNFDGLDLDWEYPKCWQVWRNPMVNGKVCGNALKGRGNVMFN